jgi:hypothetical protein
MPFWINLSLGDSAVRLRSEFNNSHRHWPSVQKMNSALHRIRGWPAISTSYSGHTNPRDHRCTI